MATPWQQHLSVGNGSGGLIGRLGSSGSFVAGLVEGVGDLVEPVAKQVSVDVHRHRGTRMMSEHLLNDLYTRAARDRKARGGVAQLVRVKLGNADHLRGRVESRAEDRSAQRSASGATVVEISKVREVNKKALVGHADGAFDKSLAFNGWEKNLYSHTWFDTTPE